MPLIEKRKVNNYYLSLINLRDGFLKLFTLNKNI